MTSEPTTAEHYLSRQERDEIEQLASLIVPYSQGRYREFIDSAQVAAGCVGGGLRSWADLARSRHVGLLHGLPVGEQLPSTPTRKAEVDRLPMFADQVMGLVSALFGDIVTFEGKVTRRQIHNVYPAIDEAFGQLGASSEELEWHVEDAFHPERADWLGILCLRGDPQVTTWVARAKDLELSPDDMEQLRAEEIQLVVDDSFVPGLSGRRIASRTFSGPLDDPEIAFDPAYTEMQGADQEALLDRVANAAVQARLPFTIEDGDFLILNNRRTIHGRSAHHPRRDGADRWIKRALVCEKGLPRTFVTPGYVKFRTD